jgi:hypothetical protein
MSKNTPSFPPAIGIDVGTYTIVVARRGPRGEIEFKTEINGYFEVPNNNSTAIMANMLRASKAPIYTPKDGKKMFVLGRKAREIAYSWTTNMGGSTSEVFRRTMRDGILSSSDGKDVFNALATMVTSMARPVEHDGMPIAFPVPGTPHNRSDLTTQYHEKVVGQMLSVVDGKRPDPFGVNEAQAIIYAECEEEGFTGVAMSFGAGMTNVCLSITGVPIFSFSIVGGGDSVDREAGKHCGLDPVVVNVIKMGNRDEGEEGIDLTKDSFDGPNEFVLRTIRTHYEILIDQVVKAFSEYVARSKARVGSKPSVVVAGGTSKPDGFLEMLERKMRSADMGGLVLGEFRRPSGDPLTTVAKGLLRAAETYDRKS